MLLSAAAIAQPYPNRSVRIIVPYPPGGGTDVLSRIVGKYLGDSFKQPVVVENRAGANGQIGMDLVTKAPADGYTLLAVAAGPLNEDNLKRFTPIALFAAPAYVLVLHPSVDASSVKGLIALAKSQPGRLAYASSGGGAASHLSMELFKAMAGVELLHVPYKGVGNAVNDLLGGQVQLMLAPSQAVMQHVKSAKLKALAVSGAERSPSLPDLPTISEAGVPGYESAGWFGLVASAGTPGEVVTKLNHEVNGILQLPDVKARLADLGATPASLTPQQFLDFIRGDNEKWAKLIKERG
ncbi:MAG: Bug family tripartite tricarboxylate transporter substrate binding protein, partial [Candidatus Rokuibacteriota bacterium]